MLLINYRLDLYIYCICETEFLFTFLKAHLFPVAALICTQLPTMTVHKFPIIIRREVGSAKAAIAGNSDNKCFFVPGKMPSSELQDAVGLFRPPKHKGPF